MSRRPLGERNLQENNTNSDNRRNRSRSRSPWSDFDYESDYNSISPSLPPSPNFNFSGFSRVPIEDPSDFPDNISVEFPDGRMSLSDDDDVVLSTSWPTASDFEVDTRMVEPSPSASTGVIGFIHFMQDTIMEAENLLSSSSAGINTPVARVIPQEAVSVPPQEVVVAERVVVKSPEPTSSASTATDEPIVPLNFVKEMVEIAGSGNNYDESGLIALSNAVKFFTKDLITKASQNGSTPLTYDTIAATINQSKVYGMKDFFPIRVPYRMVAERVAQANAEEEAKNSK